MPLGDSKEVFAIEPAFQKLLDWMDRYDILTNHNESDKREPMPYVPHTSDERVGRRKCQLKKRFEDMTNIEKARAVKTLNMGMLE